MEELDVVAAYCYEDGVVGAEETTVESLEKALVTNLIQTQKSETKKK